jgi:putative ABC transport system permease protein
MLRATLKSLLSRKLRLLLSGVAVVLAVMFVSAAFVLTETMQRSVNNLFTDVYDYTDIQVTAKPKIGKLEEGAVPDNIEASVVDRVKSVPGVAKATGQVFADGVRAIGKNGKVVPTGGFGAPRFGASWGGEDALVKLRKGHGPQADNEVAVNAALATAGKLKVGDQIDVLSPLKPRRTFTIVGIMEYAGGRDSISGEHTIAFTVPVAQELLLGQTGVFNQIDVKVASGQSLTKVRDDLRALLGAHYEVDTGKDLAKKSSDAFKPFADGFRWFLLGFAAVALLVGVFLILNTFSIIVAQRTQELALLRAMGAGRTQMIGSVLLESLIVGVLASAIGYGVGIGLGALGASLVSNLFSLKVAGLGIPLVGLIASFAVGVVVTMVSALLPAVRASRVPPVAAMREAATGDKPLTKITVSGAIVTAAGAASLALGLTGRARGNTLEAILLGVFVTFIGVALLTPLLSRPVVSILGRLFSWSLPGQLGRRNSARNPRRTAITAAAMMIGIAVVTAISTVFASLTASVNKLIDAQLHADLIIAGQQMSAIPPAIEPAALDRIRQLPDIDLVAADAFDGAMVNGKQMFVLSWDDIGAARVVTDMKRAAGSIDSLDAGTILVDERTADDLDLTVGGTVTIQLARLPERTYRVAGIFAKTRLGDGIVVPWADAQAGFRSNQPAQAFAKLKHGASMDSAKAQVDEIIKNSPEVTVQTRAEYVAQATSIFTVLLGVVQVLLFIALIIAVLGIVNTLVLSVLERTRELGLLRAIGMLRSQAMRMITVESMVISLFGALLGIGVGVGLGAAMVRALRDQGFSNFALPWGLMIAYVLAGAVVGVLAAVLPAIRVARLNVLNAIAYE